MCVCEERKLVCLDKKDEDWLCAESICTLDITMETCHKYLKQLAPA